MALLQWSLSKSWQVRIQKLNRIEADQLTMLFLYSTILLLKVAKIEKAFPLWTARDMRWRRNIADRASKFAAIILRPSSRTSSNLFSPHVPDVSIAIGTKSIPAGKSEYLVIFFSSAIFTAEPAEILWAWMCEIAKVSGQVASHDRHRNFFQSTVVIPDLRNKADSQKPDDR